MDEFVTKQEFNELVTQMLAMNLAYKAVLRSQGVNLENLERLRVRYIAEADQKMAHVFDMARREQLKELKESK